MISLSDLVTLAKAGWSPKAVKETVELFQTVPEAKEAEIKSDGDKVEIKKKDETTSPDEKPADESQDDAIAKLKELLKEE